MSSGMRAASGHPRSEAPRSMALLRIFSRDVVPNPGHRPRPQISSRGAFAFPVRSGWLGDTSLGERASRTVLGWQSTMLALALSWCWVRQS